MLKNKFLWIAVVVLLLAAGLVMGWKKMKQPAPVAGPAAHQPAGPEKEAELPLKDLEILPKRETNDEFKDPRMRVLSQQDQYTPSLEDLQGFLDAHQRNQDSLLAAYAVCKDQRVLEELLASAPNERTYQAVMLWSEDDDVSAKALQSLKALNPKSPVPYLVGLARGEELAPEEMKKALAAMGNKPEFDLSGLRQPALRNEAWQSVVKDPVKAWAYSLQSMNLELETIDTLSTGILNLQTATQTDENPDNFSQALALTKALRKDDADISSISESKENDLELEILGTVSAESPYPGSHTTVQQRIDQLEAKQADEGTLDEKMQAFLQDAEPAAVDAFVKKWNEKGMNKALKSLDQDPSH